MIIVIFIVKALESLLFYLWCQVLSVAYFRTVLVERWVPCRGGPLEAEHLSIEAGFRWSESTSHESMPPSVRDLWPVNQRPLHDMRWNNYRQHKQNTVSYSQENIRRQNRPSRLQRATG